MVWLDVPYPEKDIAKGLGARWDPSERKWFVPHGVDTAPFAQWLPVTPTLLPGPQSEVPILGLIENCWKCGGETRAVAGVHWTDEDIDAIDLPYHPVLGEALAAQPYVVEHLAMLGVGELKRRFSKTEGAYYWSNGCRHCDALLGNVPLWERFVQVTTDVTWEDLVLLEAPVPWATIDFMMGVG